MNYRHVWAFAERVRILSVTPIGGWGVGKAEVINFFPFYFCEIEDWHKAGLVCYLDEFMDVAAEVPVYYFLTWNEAEQFAKTKSNRYPLDRRIWWLRFQPQYWFATIITYMLDQVKYLSSKEREEYIRSLVKYNFNQN